MANSRYWGDSSSVDSQFTENDEELSFLEACMECDEDALYDIIQDGVTWEQVNERDKSGRTAFSYACANGFMPILELLASVEEVNSNLADNDGNTPLIFAAQAGHDDVVSFLLHQFRSMHIDHSSQLGFTALMKASIQGRTRCAKLLLFAGANPNRHDHGRGLCAEDWARFCGRRACADAISKYIRSKKYFFKKTFILSKDKWSSEPDLAKSASHRETSKGSSWIARHLSFKKKKSSGNESISSHGSLQKATRCVSSPELAGAELAAPAEAPCVTRRPSCIDGVIPLNIAKCRRTGAAGIHSVCGPAVVEEVPIVEPPRITETDYDLERQGNVGQGNVGQGNVGQGNVGVVWRGLSLHHR